MKMTPGRRSVRRKRRAGIGWPLLKRTIIIFVSKNWSKSAETKRAKSFPLKKYSDFFTPAADGSK